MASVQENTSQTIRTHINYLRADSFTGLALCTGLSGYLWLTWIVWPWSGRVMPLAGWIGGLGLVFGALLGYKLKAQRLRTASVVLVSSVLGAVICATFAYRSSDSIYLFIIPIMLANVLLSPRTVMVVTVIAGLMSTVIAPTLDNNEVVYRVELTLPHLIIALITITSLLSTRTLYTVLGWVLTAYEQAHQNELTLRQQEGQLTRVLKDLDTATYELERTNYTMKLALERAEEARRLKQQFAQNISHELRTPLNLIVGFTETMLQSPEYYNSPLPTAYLRDLNIVHRNAHHLQDLVNDVLDLARIETAQMSLLLENTDLAALVREVADTMRSLVESRQLRLRMDIAPDLPHLSIDPTRIRQVLINLIKNAVQFTVQGQITISAYREQDHVTFKVADSGVGIAAEEISRIFEAFYQVDATLQRRQNGAGLGLAISQQFVKLHHGQIGVTSQIGVGSTFYFSLPVNSKTILDALDTSLTGIIDRSEEPEKIALPVGRDRLVLLITRSPSAATMLQRYLRNTRLIVAQGVAQARQIAQRSIPQVVVVDTACEDPETAQFSQFVKSWDLPETPIIACPLPGEERLRQHLFVDGYLVKPINRQSLWDTLRQFEENIQRVLVIDDDRDFVRLISRMLENPRRHYQVFCAYTGQEAMMMAQQQQPNLILMDLGLPDLKDVELVERIRAVTVGRRVPIIVISGRDELDSAEALTGTISVTKLDGLLPGEVVRWIQGVLDTTTAVSPDKYDNMTVFSS